MLLLTYSFNNTFRLIYKSKNIYVMNNNYIELDFVILFSLNKGTKSSSMQ